MTLAGHVFRRIGTPLIRAAVASDMIELEAGEALGFSFFLLLLLHPPIANSIEPLIISIIAIPLQHQAACSLLSNSCSVFEA